MSGASFALVANMAIALLIACTFAALSRLASTRAGVGWFGVSYAIGAATPASELLLSFGRAPDLFIVASFATFSLAFHVMAKGLAIYYQVRLPRWLLPGSFMVTLLMRAAIWNSARDSVNFAFGYQLPFTLALGVCFFVLWAGAPRRRLDLALMIILGITALHFLLKPVVGAVLGAGRTAVDYTHSAYALFSQAVSAFMLVATALILILVTVRDTFEAFQQSADVDALSGVLNRRAFDREVDAALMRARQAGNRNGCALMFDLDYFKSVNDTYGHATGDRVIQAFAALLLRLAPAGAVIGRTGGEEFAAFLHNGALAAAESFAETVRATFAEHSFPHDDLPLRMTVSCGIATADRGETLGELMIRSDQALYKAKALGRNRVCLG